MGTRVHSIGACAYAIASGSNVTAVASGANTKGIYVSQIVLNSSGTGSCGYAIGANDACVLQNGNIVQEDFFIPKNVDFILKSTTANNRVMAYYKVLT